jgi:hypothetical protein
MFEEIGIDKDIVFKLLRLYFIDCTIETCWFVKATIQDIYIKYNYKIEIINIIVKINITMKINILNKIMINVIIKKIKKMNITTITVIAMKLVKMVITVFLVIIGDISWRSHLVTQTDYH